MHTSASIGGMTQHDDVCHEAWPTCMAAWQAWAICMVTWHACTTWVVSCHAWFKCQCYNHILRHTNISCMHILVQYCTSTYWGAAWLQGMIMHTMEHIIYTNHWHKRCTWCTHWCNITCQCTCDVAPHTDACHVAWHHLFHSVTHLHTMCNRKQISYFIISLTQHHYECIWLYNLTPLPYINYMQSIPIVQPCAWYKTIISYPHDQ